jgi:hypothetical protein
MARLSALSFWLLSILAIGFDPLIGHAGTLDVNICLWNTLRSPGDSAGPVCLPPLDDGTAPDGAIQLPWAHKIHCVRPKGDEGPVYCLFISSAFRNNHGVSLVTTPQHAADIAGTGILGEQYSWMTPFIPGPVSSNDCPSYEVMEIQDKGKGAVARRLIRRAEVLMVDFPALLISRAYVDAVNGNERRRMMKIAIDQLPEMTRKSVWALARSAGGHAVDDIVSTNTCMVFLGDKESHLGLFAEVSVSYDSFKLLNVSDWISQRMNHACDPK